MLREDTRDAKCWVISFHYQPGLVSESHAAYSVRRHD